MIGTISISTRAPDVKHSFAWNAEAIHPLVAENPKVALAIAEGALMRGSNADADALIDTGENLAFSRSCDLRRHSPVRLVS